MDITWKFKNFKKTIRIGVKPEGIDGDTVMVEPKLDWTNTITLGMLLDAMCVRLTRLGIELSYELDAERRLTTFTFDQKVAHKDRLAEVGAFEPGNSTWEYTIKRAPMSGVLTPDEEGGGKNFEEFKKIPAADGMEITWVFLKASQ